MQKITRYFSPYTLISLFLCTAVMVGHYVELPLYYCQTYGYPDVEWIFWTALASLIIVEIGEDLWFGEAISSPQRVCGVILRTALISIALVVDCSAFAYILFIIPTVLIYKDIGETIGVLAGIAILGGISYFFLTFYDLSYYEFIAYALTYTMSFVAYLGSVYVVKQEERSRKQTESLLYELEASQKRVTELAAAEERVRLARNIHDSLGHHLTIVGIQLDKALALHELDAGQSKESVLVAKKAADSALREVRDSVSGLRDEGAFSLQEALRKLVDASDQLQIDIQFNGNENRFTRSILMTLFRIIQEGLTNIHKHANANQVDIQVDLQLNQAHLVLKDNGQGFDSSDQGGFARNTKAHFGLQGLQERLQLIGGQLDVVSEIGRGTTLTATIPRRLPETSQ